MATDLDRREQRPSGGREGADRPRRSAARWLWAPAREVVRLSGSGRARGGAPEAADQRAVDVGAGLERWRRRLERHRELAVLRRGTIVAAAVGALAAALVLVDVLQLAVAIGVAVVVLATAVAAGLRRGPSVEEAAQLLDERLRLYDRLGTALEIERRGGARTPLERRTVGDAAELLAAGEGDWRVDGVPAPREWGGLAALLVTLAVLIGVGAATEGSGGSSTTAEHGGAGNGGAAGEAAKGGGRKAGEAGAPPAVRQGQAGQPPQRQEGAPSAGFRQLPQAPAGASPQGARGGKATGATGQGKGAHGSPAGTQNGGGAGKGGGEAEAPGSQSQPTRNGTAATGIPRGATAPGTTSQPPGATPHTGATAGAGGKPETPSTNTSGHGTAKGGAPSGSPTAGGGAGGNHRGHAAPIEGRGTQKVKLQPGYAPLPAGRGGAGSRFGKSQGGGGRGRGGQVAGGGSGGGGELSFVPASGGALPGPAPELQQRYAASLKWIERLPW
jgi:hypothetical protein